MPLLQLGPPLEEYLSASTAEFAFLLRRLGFHTSPEMVGMMAAPPKSPADTASYLLAAAMFAGDTPAKLKYLRLLRNLLLRHFAPRLLDLRSDSSGPVRQFLAQGSQQIGPSLTPAEVLITIHSIDPEKGIPLKRLFMHALFVLSNEKCLPDKYLPRP